VKPYLAFAKFKNKKRSAIELLRNVAIKFSKPLLIILTTHRIIDNCILLLSLPLSEVFLYFTGGIEKFLKKVILVIHVIMWVC